MSVYAVAAVWLGMALATSLISIRIGISVALSAFIPTLLAQQLFQPEIIDEEEEEALGAEDVAVIHRHHGAHAPLPPR